MRRFDVDRVVCQAKEHVPMDDKERFEYVPLRSWSSRYIDGRIVCSFVIEGEQKKGYGVPPIKEFELEEVDFGNLTSVRMLQIGGRPYITADGDITCLMEASGKMRCMKRRD